MGEPSKSTLCGAGDPSKSLKERSSSREGRRRLVGLWFPWVGGRAALPAIDR